MYLAINKNNSLDFHSFEWTMNDELMINGKVENINEWEIIEVEETKD
jgi:hypothetical protein